MTETEQIGKPRPPIPKKERDRLKAEVDRLRRKKMGLKAGKGNKDAGKNFPRMCLDAADGDRWGALYLATQHRELA